MVDGLNDYQKVARTTAVYPRQGRNIEYVTLGLCGEAGELANRVKKIQRDFKSSRFDDLPADVKEALIGEVGDSLWYIANLCSEMKMSLRDVANLNLVKLASRKKNGTIHGSGEVRTNAE